MTSPGWAPGRLRRTEFDVKLLESLHHREESGDYIGGNEPGIRNVPNVIDNVNGRQKWSL